MGSGRVDNELKKIVYLCLILSTSLFAILVIVFNVVLGWEAWMVPIIFTCAVICWSMYIANQASPRTQLYVCGAFDLFLLFYYCIKLESVYDCGAAIVIILFIFTFIGDRLLIWAGIIVSFAGITMNLWEASSIAGYEFGSYAFLRTILLYLMIPFSAILVKRIVKAWSDTEKRYLRKIDVLSSENERVNNFLANVSHEVRTPISAVIGLSYVLQKEELSEQNMGKVKAISAAGHRVSEQISDILDFTEIDMGKIAVANDDYMITSMINDLLNQLSLSDSYGLDLVVDIDPGAPSVLIGDESKIKRVLWHLIRNGFKYTKEGGVYLRVYAIKREYGINLILEVKDTGVGMNKDEVDNVYEKFYQVDSSRARTSSGLGLGIPIVNGLTRSMGGLVSIDSKQGEGTVVKVTIPQEVLDTKPVISVANAEKCVAAGFIGFLAIKHPKVREYYMQMISHLSAGLSISFIRVQSKEDLEKLLKNTEITHLFVGIEEFKNNRDYIISLSKSLNVALVTEKGFDIEAGSDITVLKRPFYGTQVANFLNQVFSKEKTDVAEIVTFPGVKALVVDDEHMNLIVAREIFSAYEMEITTASGGEEAIELCKKNDFDLVFMDHMMPGMDGVEAMHIIKQNASKENKEICVIALTANAISTAREMFILEGFDGFVPKPIEISDLERTLKRVLPASVIVYKNEPRKKNRKENVENKELKATTEIGDIKEDNERIENKEINAKKASLLDVLKEMGVDTDYGLDYCGQDEDFYKELLDDYADNRDGKLAEIKGYFDTHDLKNYEVRVHGIKSTSKLIGALSLSDEAKALEDAAKTGDEGYISEHHPAFIIKYEALMNAISEGGAE